MLLQFQSCRDCTGVVVVLAYLGAVAKGSCAISGTGKEWRHLLLWLVQFQTGGNCLSFCGKDPVYNFGVYNMAVCVTVEEP
jgi:hypothetical protein